ncbi:MAG: sulfotransferase [Deltaproteobacteria bacterium]|nr:sulfotransferase [Deltaproteobacteria bacterium]
MSRNTWPIIIGGCYRSGTSLVRRILNAHSRIHCGPEVKFFRDFFNDYFEDPLSYLRFTTTARSLLPQAELLEILGRAFLAVHKRAAALARKPRWADKCPENVLYLAEWQYLLGEQWLFVHVMRNPLDTLASIKERSFPHSIPASLEARIAFYRYYAQAGLSFGDRYPARYYRVIYEHLVNSPELALRSLMDWLNEKLEPSQLQFNRFIHQAGLEDPKIASTSGIHSEAVGRWSHAFSRGETRLIWRQTSDLWKVVDPDNLYLPRTPDIDLAW